MGISTNRPGSFGGNFSIAYAKGVTACSPGLQCEASYPGFRLSADFLR